MLDDEDRQHYIAEEKRRLQDFTVQCGLICHTFPQYKLDEVEKMPVNEFNKLYILTEQIRDMELQDLALAVGSCLSKKAGKEITCRIRRSEKMKRKIEV